jgi:hypothetical protein
MAYRPTNNIKENVIHRNTIFDGQGMVSCCTCGYCIKRNEEATLELTNFKAAPSIVNENSIGSTIIEFSDYMIPVANSSFNGYVLTPNPIPQSENPTGLADGLTYYPFLNCDGETTQRAYLYYDVYYGQLYPQSYWKMPSYPNEKTAHPYGVSVEIGTDGLFFNNQNLFYFTYFYENGFSKNSYLNKFNYSNGNNSGSYDLFLNYITNHDFSVDGINADTECTNNVLKIIDPVFYLDVSGYSFSYLHPDYNLVYSNLNIYPNSSTIIDPQCPTGSQVFWSYDFFTRSNTPIYKDGYILNNFSINKNGTFSSRLSVINKNIGWYQEFMSIYLYPYWVQTKRESRYFVSAYPIMASTFFDNQTLNTYGKNGVFSDPYISYSQYNYYDICGNLEEVFFGIYKTPIYFGDYIYNYYDAPNQPTLPLSYTASKTNRTQMLTTTDSTGRTTLTIKNVLWTGKTLLTNNYVHNSVPIVTISGGEGTGATARATINGGKVISLLIVNSGSGYTSAPIVTISGGSGTGATASATIFNGSIQSLNVTNGGTGYNSPKLALGTIPLYYDAILKGGFESDIIVSFQSVPYCQLINIPDRLKKVTEIKVNFENYEKIPQSNMINYDMALRYFQDTPLVGLGAANYTPQMFNQSMIQMAFTFQGYSLGGFFSPYSYYGIQEFENIAFLPPNVNENNEFFVRKDSASNTYFNVIKKNIIEIDPPELVSYVAKAGRVYPDFGVPDRFKSCLLINGDPDVWKTGNEVQFIGLDYLVTNGGSGYTYVPTVTLSGGGGTGATATATISGGKVVAVTVVNKGKNYTSNKNVVISGGGGNGATAVDITFTPFYSIYMEEIKDEKQTAGQSLIRIATTLQNANDGIYIPNVGLETLYKDKSLSVKFLSNYKDVSINNLPRYENVNPNNIDITNVNADILGASYSSSINYPTSFNSKFNFSFSTSGTGGFYDDPRQLIIKFSMPASFPNNPIYLENFSFDGPTWYIDTNINRNFEIISLSPLKIKYFKMKFDNYHNTNARTYYSFFYYNFPRTNINVTFPWSDIESNLSGALLLGFQCDVIIEEVVNEFIEEALPLEFNQILEGVQYIETSNLMNSRTPMQMINPEQCEHIGKVIDRKDCNCPKKWVRLCDVHGKTDWKKCMQCKDFKVSE